MKILCAAICLLAALDYAHATPRWIRRRHQYYSVNDGPSDDPWDDCDPSIASPGPSSSRRVAEPAASVGPESSSSTFFRRPEDALPPMRRPPVSASAFEESDANDQAAGTAGPSFASNNPYRAKGKGKAKDHASAATPPRPDNVNARVRRDANGQVYVNDVLVATNFDGRPLNTDEGIFLHDVQVWPRAEDASPIDFSKVKVSPNAWSQWSPEMKERADEVPAAESGEREHLSSLYSLNTHSTEVQNCLFGVQNVNCRDLVFSAGCVGLVGTKVDGEDAYAYEDIDLGPEDQDGTRGSPRELTSGEFTAYLNAGKIRPLTTQQKQFLKKTQRFWIKDEQHGSRILPHQIEWQKVREEAERLRQAGSAERPPGYTGSLPTYHDVWDENASDQPPPYPVDDEFAESIASQSDDEDLACEMPRAPQQGPRPYRMAEREPTTSLFDFSAPYAHMLGQERADAIRRVRGSLATGFTPVRSENHGIPSSLIAIDFTRRHPQRASGRDIPTMADATPRPGVSAQSRMPFFRSRGVASPLSPRDLESAMNRVQLPSRLLHLDMNSLSPILPNDEAPAPSRRQRSPIGRLFHHRH